MPNHVYHTIAVDEKYAAKLEEISQIGICRYYLPMPTELEQTSAPNREDANTKQALIQKYGADDWYTWCNNNWGTKWGCYDNVYEDGVYRFTTAWSPFNDEIMDMLLVDIPNLVWNWEEEQGFGAETEFYEGKVLNYEDYDIVDWSEEVQIPHPTLPHNFGTITLLKEPYHRLGEIYEPGWYADWSEHEFLHKTKEGAIKEYKKGWVKYQN